MLTTLAAALTIEKREGDHQAEQFIARIDSHIRDLETLKAWVKDSARLRSEALDSLLGNEPAAAATEIAIEAAYESEAA